jgi:hypothetical protein
MECMLTRLAKHVTQGTKKKSESLRTVGPGHVEKKWSKTPGPGRGQKWTLCSQVLLFSGKSGTLLQQYAIGMRKVSGFALFAIKSHRVCSFSKNGTEDAKKQKAGLIPEHPARDN